MLQSVGSWHHYLGPGVSLHHVKEEAVHLMAEGSSVMAYLSGASFLLFPFGSVQGPAHGAPHSGQALALVSTLKTPSQMELQLCLCNLPVQWSYDQV